MTRFRRFELLAPKFDLDEQIFFRVCDQLLQDVLENVVSAPESAFMINAVPINHATPLLKTIITDLPNETGVKEVFGRDIK